MLDPLFIVDRYTKRHYLQDGRERFPLLTEEEFDEYKALKVKVEALENEINLLKANINGYY